MIAVVGMVISLVAVFVARHYAGVAKHAQRSVQTEQVAKIFDTHSNCVVFRAQGSPPCCEIDTFKNCSKSDRAWLRSMGKGP